MKILDLLERLLDLLDGLWPLIVAIALLAALFGGMLMFANDVCAARWEEKRKPEFMFFSGCTVLTDNGERVPARNVVVMP